MTRTKSGQLKFESSGFNIESKTEEVRGLIAKASEVLNSMGAEYSRFAWLLEDTMGLIEETQTKGSDRKLELEIDYLSKPFEEEAKDETPEVKIIRK